MKSLSSFNKGVNTDNSKINQPDNTASYVLNGVQISEEGDLLNYSNEKGTLSKVNNFPTGFKIIGGTVLNTDLIVFLVDPINNYSQIGIIDNNFSYSRKAPSNDTGNQLQLSINHQVDCVARKLFTGERIVYFVDFNRSNGFLNLDNPPADINLLDDSKLIPNQNIPNISLISILETSGNLNVGVYQVITRYKTSTLNATSFGIPSQPIPIVKGLRSDGRDKYEGDYYDYGAVQKTINLEISNIDTSYPFLEVVIIHYINSTNTFTAVALPLYNIVGTTQQVSYNGTEANVTPLTQDEIGQLAISYDAAKCIEQKDSMLLISNLKETTSVYDTELQQIANNIRVTYKIEEIEYLDGSSSVSTLAFDISGLPYILETPTETIYVKFNANIDQTDAEDITKYSLDDGAGGFTNPTTATLDPTDPTQVILVFSGATIDFTYSLQIGTIKNYVGDQSYDSASAYLLLQAGPPFVVTGSTTTGSAQFNDYKDENLTFTKKGYQRDEVYSLMMGVIFNDGSNSLTYHIPASNAVYRALFSDSNAINAIPDTPGNYFGETTGELGVYRSILEYPLGQNYPSIPDSKIRHHKMPTLIQEPHFRYDTITQRTYIRVLGLEFTFLQIPSITLKNNIQSIVFFRQRRNVSENKSIIAQGLVSRLVRTANDYKYSDGSINTSSYVYKKMPFFNNSTLSQSDVNPPGIGGSQPSAGFTYDSIQNDKMAFFSPDTIFGRITSNEVIGANLESVLKVKGKLAPFNTGGGTTFIRSETKALFAGVISLIPPINLKRWTLARFPAVYFYNNYYKEDNSILPSSVVIDNSSYVGNQSSLNIDNISIDNGISGKFLYIKTTSNVSDFGVSNPISFNLSSYFYDISFSEGQRVTPNNDSISVNITSDTNNNLYNIKRINTQQYGSISASEGIIVYKSDILPTVVGQVYSNIYGGDIFISKFSYGNKDIFAYRGIYVQKAVVAAVNYSNDGKEAIPGASGMDLRALSYFFVESVINTNYRHRYRAPGSTSPTGVKYFPFDSADTVQAEDPRSGDSDGYNTQYSFENTAKLFYTKPLVYNTNGGNFECRTIYSEQARPDDVIDNYRTFLQNSFHDIPKNTGMIWNTFVHNNTFYIHTPKCLWRAFVNDITQQVTTLGQVIVGTGGIFAMPSKEVTTADGKGYGGTISQFAGVSTPFGYVFPDVLQGKIFLLGSNIVELSQQGIMQDMHRNLAIGLSNGYIDNPSNPLSAGIIGGYDHSNKRYILTKRGTSTDFTWSYSLLGACWSSQHTYKPHLYLASDDRLFGFTNDTTTIECHQHNVGPRGIYYSQAVQPFIFEYIVNPSAGLEKRYDNIYIQSSCFDASSNYLNLETFKSIECRTNTQNTGVVPLLCLGGFDDGSNVHKVNSQFQIDIPHNASSVDPNFPDRMSGTHMSIRLTYPNTADNKIVLNFITNVMRPVAR